VLSQYSWTDLLLLAHLLASTSKVAAQKSGVLNEMRGFAEAHHGTR
jgi:hypothetical protein